MDLELDIDFGEVFSPENFFFGVANAPYLCEGGYNTPDGPKNSLAPAEASGAVPVSGETTRFWTDYRSHVELAASLGLNAFRMGVDWSRTQPSPSMEPLDEPPAWDGDAVAHYAEILRCVQDHGMAPIVTLHHFLHPMWTGLDMWTTDRGPALLHGAMLRAVTEINGHLTERGNPPLGNFVVFNEVNLVPLIVAAGTIAGTDAAQGGFKAVPVVCDRVLSTYVGVYDALHDLYEARGWPAPLVGFGTASLCTYELDKLCIDLVRLRDRGVSRVDAPKAIHECRDRWLARIDPLAASKLLPAQREAYRKLCDISAHVVDLDRFDATLDAVYASPRARKTDYISANIYEPFSSPKGELDPSRFPAWWENAADTRVYRTFIEAYHDGNEDLPIFMGENSIVYRQPVGGPAEPRPDGWTRERYLKAYLMEIVRCIKSGIPIRGYLWWSLVDDFEWDAGFDPRMGLYNYDYEHHRIGPTDGLGEPAGPIYAALISALRSGDPAVVHRTFTNRIEIAP